MDLNNMRRAEFYAVPSRKWNDTSGTFNLLVLLPTKRKHDSGYGMIDVVGVNGDKMVRLSGCSDALHLQGGNNEKAKYDESIVWNIDLLWRSKLFCLFTHKQITAGAALSSLFLYGGTK